MTREKYQILPPRFRNQTSNNQEYDSSKPSPAYSRRELEAGRRKLGEMEAGRRKPGEMEVGRRKPGEIGAGRRKLVALGAGRGELGAREIREGRREPGDMEVVGRREPGRTGLRQREQGEIGVGQRKLGAIGAERRGPGMREMRVGWIEPGDMRVRQRETITIGVTREPFPVDPAARHQFCSRHGSASSFEDDISPVLETRNVSPVLETRNISPVLGTRQVSWTRSAELNQPCSLTVYVTSNSFRRKPSRGGDSRSYNNSRGWYSNNCNSSNGMQGWKKNSTYKSSNPTPTRVQIKTVHDAMTVQAEVLDWIRKQWATTAAQLRNKTVNYYH